MTGTASDVLEAGLALEPEEREHVAHELLASISGDHVSDDDLRVELIRRARDVREGRASLVDGPSSLRAIRDRLQTR